MIEIFPNLYVGDATDESAQDSVVSDYRKLATEIVRQGAQL